MDDVILQPWRRKLRKAILALTALVALYAAVGFLVVPPIARAKLEALATDKLGRHATLGKLAFNPFTLRARLSDFSVADREQGRTLFRFDTLLVDLSMASVWKRAPVLDAVRLVRPVLELVRDRDGSYNIGDLATPAPAGSKGATPLFSVNNIEIEHGTLSLDDRERHRKFAVSHLEVGIPFLSSLPHDAQIRVTPRLEGVIDGARFALAGSTTTPFADREEASLRIDVDTLALPRYAEYLELPQGIRVSDGSLTTRLRLAFVTEKGVSRSLALSGTARIDGFAVVRGDGTPLLAARTIEALLAKLDLPGRTVAFERVALDAPELALHRLANGALDAGLTVPAPSRDAPALPRPAAALPPWTWSLAEARIANGTLHLTDDTTSPPFRATLANVNLQGSRIASNTAGGTLDLAFDADEGAHFAAHGEIDLRAAAVHGHATLSGLHPAMFRPYYAPALDLDLRRGTIDLAADFSASSAKTPLQFNLSRGSASVSDVELAIRGAHDPSLRVAHAELADIALDLDHRNVDIGRIASRGTAIRVVREADGRLDFQRLVHSTGHASAHATGPATGHGAATGASWNVLVRRLLFERLALDAEDRMPQPPVKLRVTDARIEATDIGNARGARGTIEALARIGAAGRVSVKGALAVDPAAADLRITAQGIDLVPLRPYVESRTNIIVTRGFAGAKGRVTYADGGPAGPRATFAGDFSVSDFDSLDRPTSQELLRWKTLALTGVDAASAPVRAAFGAVALDRFYARLIVNPDATLNLQRLLAADEATSGTATPAGVPAASMPALAAPTLTRHTGNVSAQLPPTPSSGSESPVSIGRIDLANGEIDYSDFFVKPNYSARLTDVAGSVSALSARQAGDVTLTARVEGTAPVEVRGSINPFARELTLDLTANAHDIDLPPLTPYSAKYAGYGIEKGKLSLEVHYRIDDRKLTATNKLELDQLTFGQHVDSPVATKLPLMLAVALLKDRNGVIRLDLPIEGTLDDPKFSVGRVIVQIVVNLITRAVTAPFALLASLAGGHGGDELAYIGFAPGRAELSAAATDKLRSLARALTDRPGLQLDIAGRALPDTDRDGLKHLALDRALRAQRRKLPEDAEAVTATSATDATTISIADYPRLLAAAYRDSKLKDKPRNLLGLAKDIPPAQMEALLLASYSADDDALRTLANRRAQAVKAWLVDTGGIATSRIFVLAPKLGAAGIADQGPGTRADLSLH